MPWDDARIGFGAGKHAVGGVDETIYVSAAVDIDERVEPVHKGVAHVYDVGTLEPDVSITVGVRRCYVLDADRFVIPVQRHAVGEGHHG